MKVKDYLMKVVPGKPARHSSSNVNDSTGASERASGESETLQDEERAFRATDEDLLAEEEHIKTQAKSSGKAIVNVNVARPYRFVPLQMGGRNGRTHVPNSESTSLIDEIGGLSTLEAMTTRFYEKAFRDATLDQFLRSHGDPHAKRFSRWIHQKLTGSSVWDDDRRARSKEPVKVANGHTVVVHDRTSAHVAAWNSPKRTHNVGRHFELDECRVWMRLHFWAMRECIGDKSPSFADFYVRFIGHFVSVYESSAPTFARDSYRWSAKPENTQDYLNKGRQMDDVLGVSIGRALEQLPDNEATDTAWPYV